MSTTTTFSGEEWVATDSGGFSRAPQPETAARSLPHADIGFTASTWGLPDFNAAGRGRSSHCRRRPAAGTPVANRPSIADRGGGATPR